MKSIFAAAVLMGSLAQAQSQNAYLVNVIRVQGSMSCTIDTNSESVNCSSSSVAQANLQVTMKPTANGYAGVDQAGDDDQYTLVALADANQNLQDLVVMQGQSTDSTFTGSLTYTPATSLTVTNIEPLQLTQVDAQTIQMQLSYVSYKPATAGALSAEDKQALTNSIVAKVKPLALALHR